jgi:polygalacturonase
MTRRPLVTYLSAVAIALLAGVGLGQTTAPGAAPATSPAATFNVRTFGAVGDGSTKDTKAFQKALDTCAVSGGGEVLVPSGTYLIGSVQMGNRTVLRLEKGTVINGSGDAADYPDMSIRWEGRWQQGRRGLIWANSVDHIGIVGPGIINGNNAMAAPQNPRGSVVLEPISCVDIRWEDFTVNQGGMWATHPTYCTDVSIKNLTINCSRDGIDVDSCKNVRIDSCTLTTGDDCISLKSGRGMDGARIGKPTEDVVITNCTLVGRSFACVGIGSETSAGVRNVKIDHCKMTARSQAVYIKTRIGRAGATENIFGDELDVLGGGFLRINLTSGGNTNTADDPVEGLLGYPSAKNLRFTNIRLNNATAIVEAADVAPEKPVEGLSLTNITGTAQRGMNLVNIKDAALKDIQVTGVTGALLTIRNVTGTGLEGAVTSNAPAARGAAPRTPPATVPAAPRP